MKLEIQDHFLGGYVGVKTEVTGGVALCHRRDPLANSNTKLTRVDTIQKASVESPLNPSPKLQYNAHWSHKRG